MKGGPIDLVLFDLDGTLADTAPDLAAAANWLRAERGIEPLPLAELRPWASHGARGLVGRALGLKPGDPDYEDARVRFLDAYEAALCVHTRLFEGMDELLAQLDAIAVRYGVVTNKARRFTEPLISALDVGDRLACVVSGDTTPHAKPHPAPLLHALDRCCTDAARSIYVGDDLRDVQAGRAAAMRTVIAAYGYLGEHIDVSAWGGDHVIQAPGELLGLVHRSRA